VRIASRWRLGLQAGACSEGDKVGIERIASSKSVTSIPRVAMAITILVVAAYFLFFGLTPPISREVALTLYFAIVTPGAFLFCTAIATAFYINYDVGGKNSYGKNGKAVRVSDNPLFSRFVLKEILND
jgi:hypothetical protein